jgi:hypothetical protein
MILLMNNMAITFVFFLRTEQQSGKLRDQSSTYKSVLWNKYLKHASQSNSTASQKVTIWVQVTASTKFRNKIYARIMGRTLVLGYKIMFRTIEGRNYF